MVPLESSKLFALLPPGEFPRLQVPARERTFTAGQEIFREGEPGDGLYVVRSGLVQIVALLGQEERRIFSRAEPGEFFGEMAVLEDKPRSATASAVLRPV